MARGAVSTVDPAGLATAVEQAADGITLTDTDGRIQYVNPAFTALTGYSSEEVIGQTPRVLKSGRHCLEFYNDLWETIGSGKIWHGELTNRRKDGTLYNEEMRIAPVRDASGAITGYIAIKRDVTERRAHESAQAFLASIVESSDDAIVTTSPTGIVLTWNRGAEKLLGFTAKQAIGQDPSIFISPAVLPRLKQCIEYVSAGNSILNVEGACLHADGHRVPILVTGSPVRDACGKVIAATAILRDITERRKAEESSRFLAAIVESSDDAIVTTSSIGTILTWNHGAEALFGFTAEQALGRNASIFVPSDRMPGLIWCINQVSQGLSISNYQGISQNSAGKRIPVSVTASPVKNRAGNVIAISAVLRDDTHRKSTEQALQESEERFRGIFEFAPFGMCVTGLDRRFLQVNEALCQMLGYSAEQFLAVTWDELTHPDDLPSSFEKMKRLIEGPDGFVEDELRHIHRNGSIVWVRVKVSLIRNGDGLPLYFVAHVEDVTGRRQAKQQREFQHSLLRTIHDVSLDGILVVNDKDIVVSHNKRFLDVWNISPAQVPNSLSDIETEIPDHLLLSEVMKRVQNPDAFLKRVQDLYADRNANDHSEVELKDGRTLERYSTCLRNAEGQYLARVWFFRDTTERKRAEQSLRESEERFRGIFGHAPVGMYVTGENDEFLQANTAFCRMLGYREEELPAKYWREVFHPDDIAVALETKEKLLSGQITCLDVERRYLHKSGDAILCHARVSLSHDEYGTPRYSIVHVTDIRERKRAAAALAESEERFRNMADSCPSMLWVTNATGDVQFLNRACREFRGSTQEQVGRAEWCKSIHPEDLPRYTEAIKRAVGQRAQFRFEYRLLRTDGAWRMIGSNADPRFSPDGEYLGHIGLSADITERKLAEEELVRAREAAEEANRKLAAQHASLDRERRILRAFIDHVPDLMFVKDTENRFVIANPATALWGGLKNPEQLLGKTDFDLYPAEIAQSFFEDECRLMSSGIPLINHEEASADPATGEIRYALTTKIPLFDSQGSVTGLAGIARNITQRKREEMELVRARETADAANHAKSRFLANMSHEIRTPMNGVIGMAQLLLQTDLSAEQRRYAEVSQSSGHTLLTLIDQILDLSKIESGKFTLEDFPFNLAPTVDDVVQMLRNQAGAKSIDLTAYVSPHIPSLLRGDAHRLRQILTNLVANAIKFTARGGVAIHVELFKQNDRASTVRFTVTDTGIGLSQSQIDSLFVPFVQADISTTRRFGGTGLGLAISKQLVEMMGGSIGVDSREGHGSTFWFTAVFQSVIPSAQSAPAAEVTYSSQPHRNGWDGMPSGRGQKILVAEDNSTNREVVLAQLRKLGYLAEAFPDGARAVEAVQHGGFDLVLMDCSMPVMDGYQATRQIRRLGHSDLPIVALTASAMLSDRQLCLHAGMNDYLAKPVELRHMAEVLTRWLPEPVVEEPPQPAESTNKSTESTDKSIFDKDALMHRLMNDHELAGVILKGFLHDVPSRIEQLQERLERCDAPGVHAQAHSLKGAAATVAAEALRGVAFEMERASSAADLNRCRRLLPDLVEQFRHFKINLEQDGVVTPETPQPQEFKMTG